MAANAPDDEDEGIGELIVSEVIRLVEEEIQRYIATLQNQREPAQEGNDCKLCPFRKFPRRDRCCSTCRNTIAKIGCSQPMGAAKLNGTSS